MSAKANLNITAIILSGGTGSRFKNKKPKQFFKIKNDPIICLSIKAFDTHSDINEIIIVSNEEYINETKRLCNEYNFKKTNKIVKGGNSRQISSYNGVKACSTQSTHVLIHDAARPFVSKDLISDCITALKINDAICTGTPSSDTLLKVDSNNKIKSVPSRNLFYRAQTPQGFEISLIKKAQQKAIDKSKHDYTDDSSLALDLSDTDIIVVPGDPKNIKITYNSDI